jgi:uncharacterized protein (DUF488 family)
VRTATRRRRGVIFTVGHSTRPIDEFIDILKSHGVQEIVDVRTIPMSRHNPQFNETAIKKSLKKAGLRYRHLKKLGGLRHAARNSMTNLGWHNSSFRGFADYMASASFSQGLAALIKIGMESRTAIMCAEAVPWRCHRSLIGDALVKQGWVVQDIMSRTALAKHRMTPFLKVRKGQLTYPEPD